MVKRGPAGLIAVPALLQQLLKLRLADETGARQLVSRRDSGTFLFIDNLNDNLQQAAQASAYCKQRHVAG